MVQKYTIWKLLIQNLNKENRPVKGFTLLELVFGMLITIIVGGLALNAFIQASNSFNEDKKNIDSSQKLSAVLELIGNDVRQSGEQINQEKFPVIEIEPNTDAGSMAGSSKITIRRSLSVALTLCESIAPASTNTTLVVNDNALALSSCNVGTLSTTAPTRPNVLRQARDKRCLRDNNPSDDPAAIATDFCQGTTNEVVMAAMSDGAGNIRTFRYLNDAPDGATKYKISIDSLSASTPTAVTYAIEKPIYLIEESIYSLTSDGRLQVKRDGGTTDTLVKGITAFNVAARVYGNKTDKISDPIDATGTPVAPSLLPVGRRCDSTKPFYICSFNARTGTPIIDDWKTLQGVRVTLEAKYDPAGRASETSTNPSDIAQVNAAKEKLKATAEYFPRNVLSR